MEKIDIEAVENDDEKEQKEETEFDREERLEKEEAEEEELEAEYKEEVIMEFYGELGRKLCPKCRAEKSGNLCPSCQKLVDEEQDKFFREQQENEESEETSTDKRTPEEIINYFKKQLALSIKKQKEYEEKIKAIEDKQKK